MHTALILIALALPTQPPRPLATMLVGEPPQRTPPPAPAPAPRPAPAPVRYQQYYYQQPVQRYQQQQYYYQYQYGGCATGNCPR